MFKDATLLVTGGTGTFGNAVVDRVLSSDIREIRIFSRDEKKQDDMRRKYGSAKLKFYLGDVRSAHGLRDAMHGVDYVFHAAALKQVPSCEFFPVEALRTNALGAENVLNEAIEAGVKRVVMLSTDKAVYPINAMGISKAMMEKIAVAKSRVSGEKTTICITRYGNVMASRGSVIPLFLRQLQDRQPITITDPNMTRFMMTIDGAVDLVLFAFDKGRSGDTFVQKAPAATLDTLVAALRRLLSIDTTVEVIGTRHGEKMHETLLTREERGTADSMGDYYRVPCDTRDLNYNLYYSEGDERVSHVDDYNSSNTQRLDIDGMIALLQQLDCVQQALRGERVDA
jgi:UDP-glucose 4-epimerase